MVCFECGGTAEHDHHVVPKSKGGTKTVPLCLECHGKVHGRQLVSGELIRAGQAKAKAAGIRWGGSAVGRRLKVTDAQVQVIVSMAREGQKIIAIARATGLTRPTIYSYLPPEYFEIILARQKVGALRGSLVSAAKRKAFNSPVYAQALPLIRERREAGDTLQQISDVLNSRGLTTVKGAKWNKVQVRRLVLSDTYRATRAARPTPTASTRTDINSAISVKPTSTEAATEHHTQPEGNTTPT